MTEHRHEFQGQPLVHSHPDGDKPHGYFEHPEDGARPADRLEQVAGEGAAHETWDAVRKHLRAAVLYELPRFAGHARGGSVSDREAWRRASPEDLAGAIVTYAMAGIGPVLFREQVDSGVRMIRAVLDRAGIDPATLTWHEEA